MPPTKTRTRPVAEIRPVQPPAAEIVVGPQTVTVTVALPDVDRTEADILLTRNSVRVRSRATPGGANYVIPLPVSVEPERYILRCKNGVFDFVVQRASR